MSCKRPLPSGMDDEAGLFLQSGQGRVRHESPLLPCRPRALGSPIAAGRQRAYAGRKRCDLRSERPRAPRAARDVRPIAELRRGQKLAVDLRAGRRNVRRDFGSCPQACAAESSSASICQDAWTTTQVVLQASGGMCEARSTGMPQDAGPSSDAGSVADAGRATDAASSANPDAMPRDAAAASRADAAASRHAASGSDCSCRMASGASSSSRFPDKPFDAGRSVAGWMPLLALVSALRLLRRRRIREADPRQSPSGLRRGRTHHTPGVRG